MPNKTNRRKGRVNRNEDEKKQYKYISYWTRLVLIKQILGENFSATKACKKQGLNLTTGCLIFRTFIKHERIMKKKEPPLSEKELRKRLEEIPVLEEEVKRLRADYLQLSEVKNEEFYSRFGEVPELSSPSDNPDSEAQIKLEPQEQSQNYHPREESEEVKREEEVPQEREEVRSAAVEQTALGWYIVFPIVWSTLTE